MNYTSAAGLSVHQMVSLIMSAKPLDVIVGQPTTKSMNKITEQMAQMVAPIKTTAWGGWHGSLALDLDNTDYKSITKLTMQTTRWSLNQMLSTEASPINQPHSKSSPLKQKQRHFKKNFNIRVQCIIDCVKEQYLEELNEEYFGYAISTIKSVLHHLHKKWWKIMTRECKDATDAFYQAWVPNMTRIITFGCQLNKQQKNAKQ
jgi:hypothetical protein